VLGLYVLNVQYNIMSKLVVYFISRITWFYTTAIETVSLRLRCLNFLVATVKFQHRNTNVKSPNKLVKCKLLR